MVQIMKLKRKIKKKKERIKRIREKYKKSEIDGKDEINEKKQ